MPVLIQRAWYTRAGIQANPGRLYVWGDNLARYGGAHNPKSGQAFACRGERNAVGIPTKRLPSMKDEAFVYDSDMDEVRPEIDAAFDRLEAHLVAGGDIVWPADGIGTGRALLDRKAPLIWNYLEARRRDLINRFGSRPI